jgi:hypothetical protein
MTVSSTRLGQGAGIAAATAGLIFILVQINHPAMEVASATTTEWVVRSTAKAVMSVLALAGITGMYLRQFRHSGVLGLAGYLLFSLGYFVMFGVEFLAAFVLPTVAHTAPGYVNDVIVASAGGTPSGDIGLMQAVFVATAAGYVGGGLLFGIATFRAGVLARWAAVLLAVGNVSTLALSVLPESFNRPLAVPTGIALIGLGASLWRDQRGSQPSAAVGASTSGAAAPAQASVR